MIVLTNEPNICNFTIFRLQIDQKEFGFGLAMHCKMVKKES